VANFLKIWIVWFENISIWCTKPPKNRRLFYYDLFCICYIKFI